ncbi:hypothetical protein ACG0Z6_01425 [Roseateles sp. BYS180W]|uniref:Type 4 fimbrial biogenesis protein PilX N-terminal domain-containing protein n=1 Tax=Roseateles rivi TaxID=3299028 RepID=A0ABW7FRE9_9BURK
MKQPLQRRALSGPQRGVVLVFALIALVLLLIGAGAVVRSMNTSLFSAGNYGFKRDLTHQSDRGMVAVLSHFTGTGALATEAPRRTSAPALNYSAAILPTNAQGIPRALLSEADFANTGSAANDIVVADMGVSIRWVVDRLCSANGPADHAHCASALDIPKGGSASQEQRPELSGAGVAGAAPVQIVYRVSMRISGPRHTQAFVQSTFTP